MTYENIITWNDLEDNGQENEKDKPYPREGLEPSEDRIAELLSAKNKAGRPLIRKTKNEDDPDLPHVGGGYYELSNGERIGGKDEAIKAEKALKK